MIISDKTDSSAYERGFRELVDYCKNKIQPSVTIKPKAFLTDFEEALVAGVRNVFPQCPCFGNIN
jgi:hypothetical protein